MLGIIRKLFGSRNEKLLKQLQPQVAAVNLFKDKFAAFSDIELKSKTAEFKKQLKNGKSVDDILPEAFAVVREAGKRTLNMCHFDVQLIGGMVLHQGKIAEMFTGEGKTLMATLPAYLNALTGKGVHIVTVNDYLAERDRDWMAPLYDFLGLTSSVIKAGMEHADKKAAYAADIVYGTNNEFGFDYLRDNMAFSLEDKVQKELNFAVVDEVDSILIDEARTPLIISGALEDSSELYKSVDAIIDKFTPQLEKEGEGDYSIDEKARQVFITESGHDTAEQLLTEAGLLQAGESLYAAGNMRLVHHLYAALRAHTLYKRDIDYIVKDDKVIIVDEHTGRTMPGRRWGEGLHQAVEAKENVAIQSENQTLASITFQNYFRLYNKLSGMTGTADTEAYEFQTIYGLEVVVIPTNKPLVRADNPDLVYLTQQEKFDAIITDIKDCREREQPVLVGTASIATSEVLSKILNKNKIPHTVLNAKYHAKEAQIIAQAGMPGAVTIATNMAGRGTDIVLGGNLKAEIKALGDDITAEKKAEIETAWQQRHEKVINAGGLHIIGTERHESRRIDNQLRGRSGRQGDSGSSRFYLSMEDNLMRIFASEKMAGLMRRLGMEKGEAITHPWVNRAIENAQRKVEGRNFDIRKQLLEFDDVANEQRQVVYAERNALMATNDVSENIISIQHHVLNKVIAEFIPPQSLEEQWDIEGLEQCLAGEFGLPLPLNQWLHQDEALNEESLKRKIEEAYFARIKEKTQLINEDGMREFEKVVMMHALDNHWREHLQAMDYLRQNINLRGYAQKDPKQEYKREAFNLFQEMLEGMKRDIAAVLTRVDVRAAEDVDAIEEERREMQATNVNLQHDNVSSLESGMEDVEEGEMLHQQPFKHHGDKVGRNQPCPCGSGKKYKHCHGQTEKVAG